MIGFVFNNYLKKGNITKLKNLSVLQYEELLNTSYIDLDSKLKIIKRNDLNEKVQDLIFNSPRIDINQKIFLLKKYDNNPFIRMSSDEFDELIKRDDINFSSIIVLISQRKEYDKLKQLQERKNFIEKKVSPNGLNKLTNKEKLIINLFKFDELRGEEKSLDDKSQHNLSDVSRITGTFINFLRSKENEKTLFDELLDDSVLKEMLYDQIILYNDSGFHILDHFIHGEISVSLFDPYEREVDSVDFIKKILSDEIFREKFYKKEVFSNNIRPKNIVFDYLPKEQRSLIGFYGFSYDEFKNNSDDSDKVSKLKSIYHKYYPDMSEKDLEFIVHNQLGFNRQLDFNSGINLLLENYEKDPEFINNSRKFCEIIDEPLSYAYNNSGFKKICAINDNYPDLIKFLVYTSGLSDEIKLKIKHIFNSPKLKGIDTINDILYLSLSEIKKLDFDDNNLKHKKNISGFVGNYIEESIVKEGTHGILVIEEDGKTIIEVGPYHDMCFNSVYYKKTGKILNEANNINYGLSIGDYIVLFEGDTLLIICNYEITKEQYEIIKNLVESSTSKAKLKFIVNIFKDGDYIEINNGEKINAEIFIESLDHLKIKNTEEKIEMDNNITKLGA